MATVHNLRFPLMLFVAIGSGLIAGIFFAFSTFVMKALAQQPPAQGIARAHLMVGGVQPLNEEK
jgi:uncharacterized membrane protein